MPWHPGGLWLGDGVPGLVEGGFSRTGGLIEHSLIVILRGHRCYSGRVLVRRVTLLWVAGGVGGGVRGKALWGRGTGRWLGLHGMGLLQGDEVQVWWVYGHRVGL